MTKDVPEENMRIVVNEQRMDKNAPELGVIATQPMVQLLGSPVHKAEPGAVAAHMKELYSGCYPEATVCGSNLAFNMYSMDVSMMLF